MKASLTEVVGGVSSTELFTPDERVALVKKIEERISELPPEILAQRGTTELSLWSENDIKLLVATMEKFAKVVAPHLVHYDVIIGDDASGRLPTLFVWHLARHVARHKDHVPKLRFIAPTLEMRFAHEEDLRTKASYWDVVKHVKEMHVGKRILFVTEYVYSGLSIRSLVNAAREAGAEADVAAVSVEQVDVKLPHYVHLYEAGNGREGRDLFEFAKIHDPEKPAYRNSRSNIVDRDQLAGVVKKTTTELSFSEEGKIFSRVRGLQQQVMVHAGRDIIRILADECAKKLTKK